MAFKADFSWIMSDRPEHACMPFNVNRQSIMIIRCGGGNSEGYVADDWVGSVCRWEKMKQAVKVCVHGARGRVGRFKQDSTRSQSLLPR